MGSQAFTKLQYGLEATDAQGTAVAADTMLLGVHPPVSPDRTPQFPEENLGVRAASMRSYIGQYLVTNELSIPDGYFQALPMIFSCGLKGGVTPSADSDEYTWAFAPSMTATNTIDSFTLEMGDDTQAYEVEYCMFDSIRLSGTVNQGAEASPVEITASYFGRQLVGTSFTALDLTSDLPGVGSIAPMNAKFGKLYVDTTWAGIGGSAVSMLRGFEVEVLTGTHPKMYSSSDKFFTEHGQDKIAVMCNFTFEGNAAADAIWDAHQAGTFNVVRLELEGPDIGGAPHSLKLDVGGYWEEVIPIAENEAGNNIHTAILHGTYDVTGAKLMDLNIVTDVAAI